MPKSTTKNEGRKKTHFSKGQTPWNKGLVDEIEPENAAGNQQPLSDLWTRRFSQNEADDISYLANGQLPRLRPGLGHTTERKRHEELEINDLEREYYSKHWSVDGALHPHA